MAIFKTDKLSMFKGEAVKKHLIMIVDDEAHHLSSLDVLLKDKYDIITALGGNEALEKIKKMENPGKLSLILCDQRMPGLSGIEFFDRIKDIIPNTIRILLTGYENTEVMIDAVNRAKIYHYIFKPFDPEDLKTAVERAVKEFERRLEVDTGFQKLKELYDELKKKNKELQDLNKKLAEQSLIDPLTKLRNLRYLQEFMPLDIAKVENDYENWLKDRSKPVPSTNDITFLLLDLDNLKSVKDKYGHTSAEKVLEQIRGIFEQICSKSDIPVFWRSDEFLIVIRFAQRDKVREMAERLRQSVKEHTFDLGEGKTLELTCSIGFASYPFIPRLPGAIAWEVVIEIATHALYAAKKSGRNNWIGIQSTDKTTIENLLERLRQETDHLIKTGELTVETSLDNNNIQWDKTRR
jgi:diguanylate cyclase (GGDEF)-like protein